MKHILNKIGEFFNEVIINLLTSLVTMGGVIFLLLAIIPILWTFHISPISIIRLLRKEVTYIVVYVLSFVLTIFTRSEPTIVLKPVKIKEEESPEN